MKFQDILKEAEATRDETYGLAYIATMINPNTKKPLKYERVLWVKKQTEEEKQKELQAKQKAERKERVKQLAEIMEKTTVEQCEEYGVTIAELIPPPKYVKKCDGSVPVSLCLILEGK